MSKKAQPISRNDLYQIEKYIYNLILFSEAPEFILDEKINKVHAVMREIEYMRMTLNICMHWFKHDPGEQPVVAWNLDNINEKCEYQKYWFFSSVKAAAYILNGKTRDIKSLCEGTRHIPTLRTNLPKPIRVKGGNLQYKSKGWLFRYKDKWDDNPDNVYRVFDPSSPLF